MVIKNVESLKDLEIIEFLNSIISKFGRRFIFIFEKRTGNIIATYDVQNIWVPDEVNRKTLNIKGREITSLLNKFQHNATMDWQFTLSDEIQRITPINVGYSENMFGFITYGMSGY